jgi:peroxiredoxin
MKAQKKRVRPGDKMRDFALESSRGGTLNTAVLRKKKILLSFHPLAWTSVCSRQMQGLERHYAEFLEANCIPLGMSVDSAPCKTAWAKSLGIKRLDLLADFWPHGGVAKKFGVFLEKDGISGRVNIVLDETRRVVYVKNYPLAKLPDAREVLRFLNKGKN